MKYFTISEMYKSSSHPELVFPLKPDSPIYKNIKTFIEETLDKVRERLGQPIIVTSGYRSAALNKAVGGSTTSQHLLGTAADLVTGNKSSDNMKIAAALLESKAPFDQLIIERPTIKNGIIVATRWIHIGTNLAGRNRRLVLYCTNGANNIPAIVEKTPDGYRFRV